MTGWWDNQDRRNKETILHEEDDALNVWMYDAVEFGGKYTDYQLLAQFLIGSGVVFGILYISYLLPNRDPAAPKQYPYNDLYLERGGDPNKMPT